MGAQWKHKGRIEGANKRGAHISKLAKEIIAAAKGGLPDPEANARLRAAIEAAKKASVPRDTIERAIKKGSGQLDDGTSIDSVFYEGFAPHQVPLIVECLTDNKNRTASDIRVIFRKGQLGAMGSVAWMFDKLGIVEGTHPETNKDIEEAAIESGAQNVEPYAPDEPTPGTHARFFCDVADLDSTSKALASAGWNLTTSEISFLAKNYPELSAEQRKDVEEFLGSLDDSDDVHRIYVALK